MEPFPHDAEADANRATDADTDADGAAVAGADGNGAADAAADGGDGGDGIHLAPRAATGVPSLPIPWSLRLSATPLLLHPVGDCLSIVVRNLNPGFFRCTREADLPEILHATHCTSFSRVEHFGTAVPGAPAVPCSDAVAPDAAADAAGAGAYAVTTGDAFVAAGTRSAKFACVLAVPHFAPRPVAAVARAVLSEAGAAGTTTSSATAAASEAAAAAAAAVSADPGPSRRPPPPPGRPCVGLAAVAALPPVAQTRGVLNPAAADVLAAEVEPDALGADNAAALLVRHLTLEAERRERAAAAAAGVV